MDTASVDGLPEAHDLGPKIRRWNRQIGRSYTSQSDSAEDVELSTTASGTAALRGGEWAGCWAYQI